MRRWTIILAAAAIASCEFVGGGQKGDPQASQEARALRLDPAKVGKSDLEQAASSDPKLQRFYQAVGWQAVWTSGRASQLLDALGEAPKHGLSARRFIDVDPNASPAAKEIALTRAALAYGRALARGFVEPDKVHEVYQIPRPDPDVPQALAAAVQSSDVAAFLRSLAPASEEYRALSDAFIRYTRQAQAEKGSPIDSGELIHPGDSDPRVPRLVESLRSSGYLPGGDGASAGDRYDRRIAEAVKRLQSDYGIETDGIVGPETLAVLNTSAADKARQLAVNLERLRWLPRDAARTRIDVNVAASELEYWRDGRVKDRRRVVVGQPDWETPQMHSPMFQLVANPTWTVPASIEEEEIAPKGPGYLEANNMVRKNGRIVQQPGPENALGLVKFDLKNDQAIYLHDTPAKALFDANERHRSHGCVRVQDALGFAEQIAADEGVVSQFERALASGEESFVKLPREIPVRLLYRTVFLDSDGKLRFVTDAYGWDNAVAAALSLTGDPRRTLRKGRSGDIGP